VVCFSRIWSVPCEAWRTGSLRSHPLACVSTPGGFFEAEICRCRPRYVRPTCATQPTCLPAPALVALVLSPTRWLRPGRDGSRDTTFHDVVARFRRMVRDGPRVLAGVASYHRASDTPVARPWEHAVLADDCEPSFEPRPPSPGFREEPERVDDPECLPSVGRSGYRAPGRSRSAPCDTNATP
jgi:hypothetical protein